LALTYALNYIHFLFLSTSEESLPFELFRKAQTKVIHVGFYLHLTQEGQGIIGEAPSRMIKKGQVTLSPLFPPSPSIPHTALAPPSQTPQKTPAPQTSFSTHSHRINRRMPTSLPLIHTSGNPPSHNPINLLKHSPLPSIPSLEMYVGGSRFNPSTRLSVPKRAALYRIHQQLRSGLSLDQSREGKLP
jgi:hypothetical protein